MTHLRLVDIDVTEPSASSYTATLLADGQSMGCVERREESFWLEPSPGLSDEKIRSIRYGRFSDVFPGCDLGLMSLAGVCDAAALMARMTQLTDEGNLVAFRDTERRGFPQHGFLDVILIEAGAHASERIDELARQYPDLAVWDSELQQFVRINSDVSIAESLAEYSDEMPDSVDVQRAGTVEIFTPDRDDDDDDDDETCPKRYSPGRLLADQRFPVMYVAADADDHRVTERTSSITGHLARLIRLHAQGSGGVTIVETFSHGMYEDQFTVRAQAEVRCASLPQPVRVFADPPGQVYGCPPELLSPQGALTQALAAELARPETYVSGYLADLFEWLDDLLAVHPGHDE